MRYKLLRTPAPLHQFVRFVRLGFLYLANEFIRVAFRHRAANSVLILRLDAVGDFVMWLSAGAREISEFSRARGRTVLLAKQDWADFAVALNLFDEVWPLDITRFKEDLRYRILFQIRIRKAGFSLVVQPRAAREFLLDDSVIRVSGARDVVGNAGDRRNISQAAKRVSDKWYTTLIENPSALTHEIEKGNFFCFAFTGKVSSSVDIQFEACHRRFNVAVHYFVVAPGNASWAGKRWPASRFAEIANRLQHATGMQCIVLGSAQDRPWAACVVAAMGGRCLDLIGETTLMEAAALLKDAKMVIANDSGLAHLASFVGTKTFALLGGGHFGEFMPYTNDVREDFRPIAIYNKMECYGCKWICKYDVSPDAAFPCIDRISVEEVLKRVQEVFPILGKS